MEPGILKLWNALFGTSWDSLSQSVPDVSAFLLDHGNKNAYTDSNSGRILGYNRQPTYKELSLLVLSGGGKSSDTSSYRVIIAEQDDSHTAGFIHRISSVYDIYSGLPLCSYAEFASAVSEDKCGSLLALIQFERVDISEMPESGIPEAISALKAALPEGALISAAERKCFWVYLRDCGADKAAFLESMQSALRAACPEITFTAGCGIDDASASLKMRTAEITLFDALQKGNGGIELYSDELYEKQKAEFDRVKRFTKLIDENLFIYNFQPIVSAQTGDIVAYEALMRTDKSVDMFPLEIIDTAAKLGRLYDIEKATMQNTLKYISRHQSVFKNKKLFVNSIPAYMLYHSDWDALVQSYGELMEKLVIEMTEQTEIENDKLDMIHSRLEQSGIKLAIDDYGTGYSNTSNLLRYKPSCIKIDRSIIGGIDSKNKVQKLISGLIEFCHENGIDVLAEGVETSSELKTVMKLGVDFIQGYYTSKPKPFAIDEIGAELKKEIAELSVMYSRQTLKVYKPSEGERVNLEKLSSERYSSIFVNAENLTIIGQKDKKYGITININDGVKSNITMKNACLVNDKIAPCIALGDNSDVTITAAGECACLGKHGILVPETASLRVTGSGSLLVTSEEVSGYGIGTDKDQSPGNITVDGTICLTVRANGEYTVAVGGGRNDGDTAVRILGGTIAIKCSGNHCVGIGNFEGDSRVEIKNCRCSIEASSPNVVAIGSHSGKTSVEAAFFSVSIDMSGENLCAVGVMSGGEGIVDIHDGGVTCDMHGSMVSCVGTRGGNLLCSIASTSVTLRCEGNNVVGIGDTSGRGDVTLRESDLNMIFGVKEGVGICSESGKITVHHCHENIHINE